LQDGSGDIEGMTDVSHFQPTLIGENVIVRPIDESDWEGMFAAASDPEIWAVHPESDRYQEPVFRKYFEGALASGSAFAFVDKDSGEIIGSSRFYGHDEAAREIEVGWTFRLITHLLSSIPWCSGLERQIFVHDAQWKK
jgi:RimJ/RimL family protein N-acetyltransferase